MKRFGIVFVLIALFSAPALVAAQSGYPSGGGSSGGGIQVGGVEALGATHTRLP